MCVTHGQGEIMRHCIVVCVYVYLYTYVCVCIVNGVIVMMILVTEMCSKTERLARVSAAMTDIGNKHVNQNVIVFAHGGSLDCCYRFAAKVSTTTQYELYIHVVMHEHQLMHNPVAPHTQVPLTDNTPLGKPSNCSISRLRCTVAGGEQVWEVLEWSKTDHLSEAKPATDTPLPSF